MAPFLAELSDFFALSPSYKKKLAAYWTDVLLPHISERFRSLDVKSDVIHALAESAQKTGGAAWFDVEQNRLKLSQLVLLGAVAETFAQTPNRKAFYPHGSDSGKAHFVSWKDDLIQIQSTEEAEALIVLDVITNVLKTTAAELASSNEKIEMLLSSMEQRKAQNTSLNEERADGLAGASS